MNHDVNLNIHYSAPQEVWDKTQAVFSAMPYWVGGSDGSCWLGDGVDLDASVEPAGLNICGEMPEDIWAEWFDTLKRRLSDALGYEIGEPEEGFYFRYWEPFRKRYAQIESIDSEKLAFDDGSVFFWNQFTAAERDITAKPPYFRFYSDLIELYVLFDQLGMLSSRKTAQSFHNFMTQLDAVGIRTLDLS